LAGTSGIHPDVPPRNALSTRGDQAYKAVDTDYKANRRAISSEGHSKAF